MTELSSQIIYQTGTSDYLEIKVDVFKGTVTTICVEDNEYNELTLSLSLFTQLSEWLNSESENLILCEEGQEHENSLHFNKWGTFNEFVSVTCFKDGYEYTVRLSREDIINE